jgi:hypothetical protein
LLLIKEQDESGTEECFKTATDIARSQKAKSFELAATISLARLLAKQGKRNEARVIPPKSTTGSPRASTPPT